MFQHQGIWLPDGEKHFPEWMDRHGELVDGRGTYQIKKYREAMKWARNFRVAVDVGAHVGLWSMQLVKRFDRVVAFEPVEAFRECYLLNVGAPTLTNELHPVALGAVEGMVSMKIDPADTGGTHVGGSGDVPLRRLDQYMDECWPVDFLKIDCEGYELEVLKGATETLKHCRPCVIVEQKPHKLGPNFGIKGTPAVDELIMLGAVVRCEMGGDYIMSWD